MRQLNMKAFVNYVVWFSMGSLAVVGMSAPTTGEYLQDKQSEYVQDRALDRVSTVNMIMCFMTKLRPDAMVNQGEYLALVDELQCQSDKSRGETTSAGADSAVNYVRALVSSSRADNTSSQIVRGRLFFTDDQGEQTIFIYADIQEAPSSTAPNGRFTLSFEAYPSNDLNTQQSKGMLQASGTTVSFYEQENRGGGQQVTQLTLQQSGTSDGSGRVRIQGGNDNVDEAFAYSASHYLRGSAGSQACFDRSRANAEFSTWRYGVYTNAGERYVLNNPGFPLNYTPTTGPLAGRPLWGFASFYGIFFPDAALAALKADTNATLSRPDNNQTYRLLTANGKLSRLSRVSTTLGNVKGLGIRLFLPSNGGFQQTEVVWDGNLLNKVRTITNNEQGENSSPETGSLSASALRNSNQLVLNGYSPSLGGEVQITVPSTGEFDGSATVVYRSRSTVTPAQADALQLVCISQCPATGSALNSPSTVYQPVNGQAVNYSPVPINPTGGNSTPPVQYTFANGVMQQGTGAVDASNATGLSNSQFRWGVNSGQMFSSSDAAAVRCNADGQPNPTGTHYCSRQVAELTDVYQYETGPNTWNQYQSLVQVGSSTPVVFDPPKKFSFLVSSTNTTLPADSPLIGSTVVLEYQGFGNLHGIPGTCVDPSTNEAVTCGPNNRYVPKFSIVDGAELMDGDNRLFVKYLDREVRFRNVPQATCTAAPNNLSLPLGLTLPNPPTNNVKTLVGSVGASQTPPTTPAVIHGVVQ